MAQLSGGDVAAGGGFAVPAPNIGTQFAASGSGFDTSNWTPLSTEEKTKLETLLKSLTVANWVNNPNSDMPMRQDGAIPDAEIQQIVNLPKEAFTDPQTLQYLNWAIQNGGTNIIDQISNNGFGLPGGRPVSDLFNPVQNVGGFNAGVAMLGAGAGSLINAGAGLTGAGDVAAVPAGAVGGGGAAGVGAVGGGLDIGGGLAGATPVATDPLEQAITSGQVDQLAGTAADPLANAVDAGAAGGAAGAVGASGGASGTAGGAAAGAGAGTALSRILDGTASTADILSVLGTGGATALGLLGSADQLQAQKDLTNKLLGFGEPSRARFEASMTPGFDPTSIPGYSGAVDTASEALLRKLSATGGNPYGNPGGMIEANKQIISGTALPAVNEYQRLNLAGGGLAALTGAAPGSAQAQIGAQGNLYNTIGSGISNLTNPAPDYSQFLRLLNRGIA